MYNSFLLLVRFRFCETHFTTHQRFVADRSAISPLLGGSWHTAIWLIHLWMCHIAHVTASRLRWMSHGAHVWMSHGAHVWMSHGAHVWMSHVTLNGSWHTYVCISLHYWLSHVNISHCTRDCISTVMNESRHTHVNESRHTHKLVTAYVNQSCHTHVRANSTADFATLQNEIGECVTSHMWLPPRWMSHGTHHGTLQYDTAHIMAHCNMTHYWMSYENVSPCTCDCVTSALNESQHTYVCLSLHYRLSYVNVSHCACDCVTSVLNEYWHTYGWVTAHTYGWVTAHTFKWFTAYVNKPCLPCLRTRRRQIFLLYRLSNVNVSHYTCDCITSVLNESQRTYMNESRHTHINESQHSYMNESWSRKAKAIGEVGGWGRDPKKCTGRDWGMGSSTI